MAKKIKKKFKARPTEMGTKKGSIHDLIKTGKIEKRAKTFGKKAEHFKKYGKPPKFGGKLARKTVKKSALSVAKKVLGKTALKAVPGVGAAVTAAEIYKYGKKVGKSQKAKSACKKKGGVYQKGYCITRSSKKKK